MDIRGVEYVFGPLSKLGLANPVLATFSKYSGRYDTLKEIDPAIRRYELPDSKVKGDDIIPFVHAQAATDHLRSVMAHAFKVRGFRPSSSVAAGRPPTVSERANNSIPRDVC